MKVIYIIILSIFIFPGISHANISFVEKKHISFFSSTYKRNVSYKSPGGIVVVQFNIQIDNKGSIKNIKTIPIKGDSTSKWYIESFGKKINNTVVGKSLKNLSIKSIGGASLTTNAFNTYIKTIK